MFRSKDPLSYFLQQKVIDFVKLLWTGAVKVSKQNKSIRIMYACLVPVLFFIGLGMGRWGIMILLFIAAATGLGIWQHFKGAETRKKHRFFRDLFITMDFKASDSLYPQFLHDSERSQYTAAFSFATLIPVSKWLARKEEMEMYFNEKIVGIRQSVNNNRIVEVLVQTRPLPEYLEWSDEFIYRSNLLSIGVSYAGIVKMNLEKHPHAFIAGETGSGKSNILKCLIHQALAKKYEVILIDFKRGVSFADFSDRMTIFYEYPEIVKILDEMVAETGSRLDKFRDAKVDNIKDYNKAKGNKLRRKIIFIDELAELLKTRDKVTANALNDSIETLTRLSRAAGIHLIMGIQRPDSTIVSGQIKNNVPFRICGRFVDPEPSRIMLSCDVASRLPNIKGRFIVKDDDLYDVQSFYFKGGYIPQKLRTTGVQAPPQHTAPFQPTAKTELAKTITKASKSAFPDYFFEMRNSFNQSSDSLDECASLLVIGQINPLLSAYGKNEIYYTAMNELALGMTAALFEKSNIDPASYTIPHIGMTFEQLLSDGNDSTFISQARYIVAEKLKNGEIDESPFLLALSAATDFIAHTAGFGGSRPSLAERLYKLFSCDEPLPKPVYIIWSALAVATEFDDDLWEYHQIKLFVLKSENSETAASSVSAAVYDAYHAPKLTTGGTGTPEKDNQGEVSPITSAPDSLEFDFSGFKK